MPAQAGVHDQARGSFVDPRLRGDGDAAPYEPANFIRSIRIDPTVFAP